MFLPPAHGFHEARVVVDTQGQVGVGDRLGRFLFEPVGQIDGGCVRFAAQQLEVEIAVLLAVGDERGLRRAWRSPAVTVESGEAA